MFSKRVYWFMNASVTVPIGPLRCFAMMISAMFSSSGFLFVVDGGTEDEHHEVGVLFERARFAEVRQHRTMIRSRFRGAAQLRQRDDRTAQFLREPLQRSRDRRKLLLTVVEAAAALHQLNVVDDQQVQAMLCLQPPRLRAHFEHADRRCVIDENLHLLQLADRVNELAVIVGRQEPRSQPVRIDARFRREQSHEQLLFRHFQREEADRQRLRPVLERRGVLRDVQHERRLAHRRTRRHQHQVARVQAGRHFVELREPGRDTGHRALLRLQLLDRIEAVAHQLAQRREADGRALVGDLEDAAFRFVEDLLRILFGAVGRDRDVVRALNQRAERRLLLDDARVVPDVRRARHAVDQARDVRRPADLVEFARAAQLLFQRDQIDRVVALGERDHLVEDAAVRVAIEVIGVDDLDRFVHRFVAQDHRAEHGAFGFEIVREGAFRSCCRFGHCVRDALWPRRPSRPRRILV